MLKKRNNSERGTIFALYLYSRNNKQIRVKRTKLNDRKENTYITNQS